MVEKDSRRDDVRVGASPVRCPYCHEGVDPGDPTWVACGACLARHHEACWDERGACSTCGGVRRLVSDARQGPPDADLVELVRSGDTARALAALRARGLDERAARVAVDLVGAALAPSPPARAAWTLSGVVFVVQALALVGCGVLALGTEAEVGAFAGLAVMVLAALALVVVAVVVGRRLTRWAVAGLAAVNLLATALGPAVVIAADVRPYAHSPELLLLGLVMGAASAGAALWCLTGRQPLARSSLEASEAAGKDGGGDGSRRP